MTDKILTATDDPANLIFTQAGKDYLMAKINGSLKGDISYFKTGGSNLFVPSVDDIDVFGGTTYTSQTSDIWMIDYPPHEIVFRGIIGPEHGDFLIGNVGVFSSDGTLLFITCFDYIHHKMSTRLNADSLPAISGGRWTFQFRIVMENINDYWDFSPITRRYAAMERHVLTDAPEYPFDSFYTEMQLDDHFCDSNRSAYVNVSGNTSRDWFNAPTQMSEANVITFARYDLDGGDEGDRHLARW